MGKKSYKKNRDKTRKKAGFPGSKCQKTLTKTRTKYNRKKSPSKTKKTIKNIGTHQNFLQDNLNKIEKEIKIVDDMWKDIDPELVLTSNKDLSKIHIHATGETKRRPTNISFQRFRKNLNKGELFTILVSILYLYDQLMRYKKVTNFSKENDKHLKELEKQLLYRQQKIESKLGENR